MRSGTNPIHQIESLADAYYGDFDRQGSTLTLTFSREVTGDCALRSLVSEIYATGALHGEPASLSTSFVEELSSDLPTAISRNASVRLGNDPDYVVFEIKTLELLNS